MSSVASASSSSAMAWTTGHGVQDNPNDPLLAINAEAWRTISDAANYVGHQAKVWVHDAAASVALATQGAVPGIELHSAPPIEPAYESLAFGGKPAPADETPPLNLPPGLDPAIARMVCELNASSEQAARRQCAQAPAVVKPVQADGADALVCGIAMATVFFGLKSLTAPGKHEGSFLARLVPPIGGGVIAMGCLSSLGGGDRY